jgi:hypothetical protein
MKPAELAEAGIRPTTIRISVGDEDPRQLIAHFLQTVALMIDPVQPGFSEGFMKPAAIDELYQRLSLDIHRRWLEAQPKMEERMR